MTPHAARDFPTGVSLNIFDAADRNAVAADGACSRSKWAQGASKRPHILPRSQPRVVPLMQRPYIAV